MIEINKIRSEKEIIEIEYNNLKNLKKIPEKKSEVVTKG